MGATTVLIPKEPLQKTVEKQIIKKATNISDTISHSMKLEDQGTSQEELSEQIKEIIADIKRRKNISLIWEDDG